jgi:hypothetical protein
MELEDVENQMMKVKITLNELAEQRNEASSQYAALVKLQLISTKICQRLENLRKPMPLDLLCGSFPYS